MEKRLLYNAIRTPDGTILESWSRNDMATHKDANGQIYMVDGGLEYVRTSHHGDERDLCIYWTPDMPHPILRQYLRWVTYGKSGKGPLKRVVLEDMESDHINAILDTQPGIDPFYAKAFFEELMFRGEEMK